MPDVKRAPYGSWQSPITTDAITRHAITLSEVIVAHDTVYWLEGRPPEGGRSVIVRRAPNGTTADVVPEGYDARTSVHEYGGGAWLVDGETVYFCNFADQRIYRAAPGKAPQAITPEPHIERGLRYADGRITPNGRYIVCVRERHRAEGEAINEVVAVPTDGASEPTVVVSGRDFYSNPRLNADGSQLCWLTWDHPNMPWDETELMVADFDMQAAALSGRPRRVAGGSRESVIQPDWGPDGSLYFSSDRSGWWNLYRAANGSVEAIEASAIEAEFGGPPWSFARQNYAPLEDGRIACLYHQGGTVHLALISADGGQLKRLETGLTAFYPGLEWDGSRLWAVGGNFEMPLALVAIDPEDGSVAVVRHSMETDVDTGYISRPQAIEYPTGGDLTAHAFFYPPTNKDYSGPADTLPPLLVVSHGGPTSAALPYFQPTIQFFTSRGFAVVDVNYGGSTGYGHAYQERLYGQRGVVDVDDCANAARFLVQHGDVDGGRLAIRGGSAGGFTTLAALAFRDVFAAGACYYGVSDLTLLVATTHKFESHYLDQLVGPYPEAEDLYRQRSALHYADRIKAPMIWFQGLDDKVVPPSQAEVFVEALQRNKIPHAYIAYEGEGHGFRRAENIKRSLEAELSFFGQLFDFTPADNIEPLNLER